MNLIGVTAVTLRHYSETVSFRADYVKFVNWLKLEHTVCNKM